MKEVLEKVLLKLVGLEDHVKKHMVTKKEFEEKIDGLYEHIDGLAGAQKTFDVELVANRTRTDRLEERVKDLEHA